MGQKICGCVKSDSAEDLCYENYEPLQTTPARSTARACLPRARSTDGDGSAGRDGGKKRRFWKWTKGRKAGESASEKAVVQDNNSTEGEISVEQVSVEVHENPETVVGEPDRDGSDKRNGVKKRFWKWEKCRKVGEIASDVTLAVVPANNSTEGEISVEQVSVEVHKKPETVVSEPDRDGSDKINGVKKRFSNVAVVPANNSTEGEISVQQVNEEVHENPETLVSVPNGVRKSCKCRKDWKADQSATEVAVGPANNSTEDEISVQYINVEVLPTLDCSVSNSSELSFHTPVLSLADSLLSVSQSSVRSVSDSSEDSFYTPALSLADLLVGIPQSSVRSISDSSEDSFHTPALSLANLHFSVPQPSVRSVSDSSEDSFHTPALSLADLLVGIPQSSVRSISDSSEHSFHARTLFLSDLLVGIPQSPVLSVSDSCEDSFHTPVLTSTDMLLSIPRPPFHSWSNLSIDSIQTPPQSGSKSSENVTRLTVSYTMMLEDDDQSVDIEDLVDVNSCWYEIGKMLGEGGYGAVYEGIRVEDGLKVAVKFVKKSLDIDYISIPCHPEPIPREIALLILANQGTHIPEIIQLLDWENKPDHYVVVLERPSLCEDLFVFVHRKGGKLTEAMAQIIMWQATKAAYICCQRGVFHRDIKLDNLLIKRDTLDVKLIDFGCGDFLKKTAYKKYHGTLDYRCPEVYNKFEYHADPATVWSLGVTLYVMLCGIFPMYQTLCQMKMNQWSRSDLSKECCSLIQSCLQEDPDKRIRLKDILLHKWFQINI